MSKKIKIDMTCPTCEDENIEIDGPIGECLSCNSNFALGHLVSAQLVDGNTLAVVQLIDEGSCDG